MTDYVHCTSVILPFVTCSNTDIFKLYLIFATEEMLLLYLVVYLIWCFNPCLQSDNSFISHLVHRPYYKCWRYICQLVHSSTINSYMHYIRQEDCFLDGSDTDYSWDWILQMLGQQQDQEPLTNHDTTLGGMTLRSGRLVSVPEGEASAMQNLYENNNELLTNSYNNE